MNKVVLATDLGGTNLRMAAVRIDGEILYRVKCKTPRTENPLDIIDEIANAIDECESELQDYEIEIIAAAVPGIIEFENGLIFKSPNLRQLDGFQMAKALRERLSKTIVLENDANAAAIGENWIGASKGFGSSIMVTLGTGVGGGIIINGEILRGSDGTAGEIGHINVEPKGHSCGCGSFGCVEQYASATAVVRMAKKLSPGETNYKITDIENLTSEDVYELAKGGDKFAREVFSQQGYYLGIMLAGLINTLNPEVIVIGGGASAGWDLFVPHLKEEIKSRSYNEPAERVRIVRAELGDDAGILGVAKLGFDKML